MLIIVLMYICICNAITERQVQEAVSNGAKSLCDLQGQLGVASCCGCCADTAKEYLPGGAYQDQPMIAAPLTPIVEPAANDTVIPAIPFERVVCRA
ncbi:(2Fe-2S)-binding protein [Alcaligenes endophyticus]|uniref:Bacterioferritin-associated ferredoxin n=2 Tax=Alcaligenes endophyticus TaxID=1929088 RepID=A0ABT8EF48_9BURK|nr:(2Fe-2S)-binding protein [Alcaligenes endophyticus]MCX5590426.1 (2Fe-2S)-binding protein [Alcaligenes endophyticus]MDN4119910.1 (2Fe-2S)-binding protein [Alcaligenes endophyticus]